MALSLDRESDIQATTAAMESRTGDSLFLSIPDVKTPWYLISLEYTQYFQHWYETVQGGRRNVVCAGGVEGHGMATDDCPLCEYVMELFVEGKRLRASGETDRGNRMKERANSLRAKSTVLLKAIRGTYVFERDPRTKQKRQVAVFDIDANDPDSSAEAGILSLSQAQWDGLIGLRNGEHTPFIESGADLANRVLWTRKVKRKGSTSKYTAVEWGAEEQESDMPDVEMPEELLELDTDTFAEVDHDELAKVAAYLRGESSEVVAEDEDVALEEDSRDDVSDDYLDDVEDDDEDDESFGVHPDDIKVRNDPPKQRRSAAASGSSASRRSGRSRV